MKKTFATALLVITLAAPSFAAVTKDSDHRSGVQPTITRVIRALKKLIGIGANDDQIVIPKP